MLGRIGGNAHKNNVLAMIESQWRISSTAESSQSAPPRCGQGGGWKAGRLEAGAVTAVPFAAAPEATFVPSLIRVRLSSTIQRRCAMGSIWIISAVVFTAGQIFSPSSLSVSTNESALRGQSLSNPRRASSETRRWASGEFLPANCPFSKTG